MNQYARVLAKKAAAFPYKKWAHISPDYEYGQNLWEEFWAYLKFLKPDVQVVQQNWPKLGESDHSSYVTALLQSGAEAFFSGLWGAQEIAFVKQARPFGLTEKVHFFTPAIGTPDELDPLGKEAPVGAVTTTFPWYDEGTHKRHPKLAEWNKKYSEWAKAHGVKDPQPKLGASWGYASGYIIAEAIKRAKSTDHDKVIAVLSEGFEMEFPWGKVIMRGCDQQAMPPQWSGVVKMGKDGKPFVADIDETPRQGHHQELRRGGQAPGGRRREEEVGIALRGGTAAARPRPAPCRPEPLPWTSSRASSPGSPTGRSSPCR